MEGSASFLSGTTEARDKRFDLVIFAMAAYYNPRVDLEQAEGATFNVWLPNCLR